MGKLSQRCVLLIFLFLYIVASYICLYKVSLAGLCLHEVSDWGALQRAPGNYFGNTDVPKCVGVISLGP